MEWRLEKERNKHEVLCLCEGHISRLCCFIYSLLSVLKRVPNRCDLCVCVVVSLAVMYGRFTFFFFASCLFYFACIGLGLFVLCILCLLLYIVFFSFFFLSLSCLFI